jgi:phosphoribosylformylglycinamidine cyclo-ligase
VLKTLLEQQFDDIHGLIHCSGGGQTKCLKYIPENVKVIKDNLFTPPVIFDVIQDASKADDREMYQVFNMGCRMEIYTGEKAAGNIIKTAGQFGIDARVIGRVEEAQEQSLEIHTGKDIIRF